MSENQSETVKPTTQQKNGFARAGLSFSRSRIMAAILLLGMALRAWAYLRDTKAFPSMLYGSMTIELYDPSDATRLATASADKFPVRPMPRDPKIGCRDWTKHEFNWDLRK